MSRFCWAVLAALSIAASHRPARAGERDSEAAALIQRDSAAGAGDARRSTGLQVADAVHVDLPPAVPPMPPPAPPKGDFSEQFTGGELGSAWAVANGNPDNYLVEQGHLLIVARSVGGFGNDKSENLFRLNRAMPIDNWIVELKLSAEMQTSRESFTYGLIEDPQNYLAAQLYSWSDCCGRYVGLRIIKVGGGQTTQFDVPVTPPKSGPMAMTVRLKKDGHEFRAGLNFDGQLDKDGNPAWVETGAVTSLRPPKTFALNAAQWEQTKGESSFYISGVTIKATAK